MRTMMMEVRAESIATWVLATTDNTVLKKTLLRYSFGSRYVPVGSFFTIVIFWAHKVATFLSTGRTAGQERRRRRHGVIMWEAISPLTLRRNAILQKASLSTVTHLIMLRKRSCLQVWYALKPHIQGLMMTDCLLKLPINHHRSQEFHTSSTTLVQGLLSKTLCNSITSLFSIHTNYVALRY